MIRTTTQLVYLFNNGNMVKTSESIWDTPEQLVKVQQDAKYGLVQEGYLIEIVNERGDVQFIRPTAVASVVVAIVRTEEIPDFQEPVYEDLQKKWSDELGLKGPGDLNAPVPIVEPSKEVVVTATGKNGAGLRFAMPPTPQQKVRIPTADGDITQPIDLGLLKDVPEDAPAAMMGRIGGFPGDRTWDAIQKAKQDLEGFRQTFGPGVGIGVAAEAVRLAAEREKETDDEKAREGAPSPRKPRRRGRRGKGADPTENGA